MDHRLLRKVGFLDLRMKPSIQKVQNPEQVRADMRRMRELLRINQDEFAELIGLSRNILHDYENGKQEWGMDRLEGAYGKIVSHLLTQDIELDRMMSKLHAQTTL